MRVVLSVHGSDVEKKLLAAVFGKPYHLERVVPLDESVRVVVDRFAGPRQESRRGVIVTQDEVSVRFAALERDSHRHLVDRAARQGVGASQGLRTEQDVKSKGPSLPNQPIQKLGGVL